MISDIMYYDGDHVTMKQDFLRLYLDTILEIGRSITPEYINSVDPEHLKSIDGIAGLNKSVSEWAHVLSAIWMSDPNHREHVLPDLDYWQAVDDYIDELKTLMVMDPVIFSAWAKEQSSSDADPDVLGALLISYATKVTKKYRG